MRDSAGAEVARIEQKLLALVKSYRVIQDGKAIATIKKRPFTILRDRFIIDVPDFPEPGIVFKDITPLLADPEAFVAAVEALAEPFDADDVDIGRDGLGCHFRRRFEHV